MTEQLSFGSLLVVPGETWVETIGHLFIEDGTKYLVAEQSVHEGYFICWKNGVAPPKRWSATGTLLHENYIRGVENE